MSVIGPHHPEVLEEDIDAEVLLLDPRNGKYYSLNETAADVWRLADGESTLDQIVTLLAKAYGVEEDALKSDVEHAIGDFEVAGLLVSGSAVG